MTWMRRRLCKLGISGVSYDAPVSLDTLCKLRKKRTAVGTVMPKWKSKIACDEPQISNLKLVRNYPMRLYFISICSDQRCITTPCFDKRMQMSLPLDLSLTTR